MAEAVLKEVEIYVSLRHNIVAQFIAARPIMDLCLAEEKRTGSRLIKRWWEQDRVYGERIWTVDW